MMCQCWFIDRYKGTTEVGDIGSAGGSVYVEAGGIWEL